MIESVLSVGLRAFGCSCCGGMVSEEFVECMWFVSFPSV